MGEEHRKVKITVRLPSSMVYEIDEYAHQTHRSRSSAVLVQLEAHAQERDKSDMKAKHAVKVPRSALIAGAVVLILAVVLAATQAMYSMTHSPTTVAASTVPTKRAATPKPSPVKTVIINRPVTPRAQSDPWAIVSEYYGDVTSSDYANAWALLGPAFQGSTGGYGSFVAGYIGTGNQDVTEVGEDGNVVTYYLTSVNPDGTTQWYSGTATVSRGLIQNTDLTQIAGNPSA